MSLKIKGTAQYQKQLASIGHNKRVVVRLVPEFHNPYDPSAVAVYADDMKVGYLPSGVFDPNSEYGPRIARIIKEREGTVSGRTVGGFKRRNGEALNYGLNIFPFDEESK